MKPLNLDNRPCSPISSNCVVWQGPNIPFINLCTGDTVSDVVAALATELGIILDQTNVSNYDLTCLGVTECGPKDFQALIQLLIDKICEAQGITNIPGKSDNGCPDCIVTVAPCFQVGNQVTMQLLDYVNMIGLKICALIDQIATINSQITDIIIRLEDLENAPVPDTEIPAFTLGCQIGSLGSGTVQFINITLQEFINNVWCSFYSVLGSTSTLIDAVNAKCISDSDLQLSTGTPYSTNAQWIDDAQYDTIADAINNLWVVVCDIYSYVQSQTLNVTDTTTIDLTYTSGTLTAEVVDTGWHDLLGFDYYTGTMATQKPQARRIGKVIHFRGNVFVPLDDPNKIGEVVNLTSSSSYYDVVGCTPYQGISGVTVDADAQSIFFNKSASVIPAAVLASGPTDGTYTMGFVIGVRPVELAGANGTSLTSSFVAGITSTKQLYISTLKDLENISTMSPNRVTGGAPLRYITSNVKTGDYVPNFIHASSHINSFPATGVNNVVTETEFPGPVDLTWTFDCDAGTPLNLGGFSFRIDGLMSYIS
jgi:hypothetical protein